MLAAQAAARSSVLKDLSESVGELSQETANLNLALHKAVFRDQLTDVLMAQRKLRLRGFLILFITILLAIQLHDLHVENCIVDNYIEANNQYTTLCDVTFPTHTHGWRNVDEEIIEPEWPTDANLYGVAGYSILLMFFVVQPYIFQSRRKSKIEKELENGAADDASDSARDGGG